MVHTHLNVYMYISCKAACFIKLQKQNTQYNLIFTMYTYLRTYIYIKRTLLQCNNHMYLLVAVEIIGICNRIHALYCYYFCHFILTNTRTSTCNSTRSIQYELLFPFNTNKIHWELFVCNHVYANREQTLEHSSAPHKQ